MAQKFEHVNWKIGVSGGEDKGEDNCLNSSNLEKCLVEWMVFVGMLYGLYILLSLARIRQRRQHGRVV